MLNQLESQAQEQGLMLRLQVRRPLGLWSLRLVVARPIEDARLQLLGEMKGWAYANQNGLQLDTMRVLPSAPAGIGDLIWAATMAWALEVTPCTRARLLAIHDNDHQHQRLVRYFKRRGFTSVREVDAALWDLPLRMVWGGAGVLMCGDCEVVLNKAKHRWTLRHNEYQSAA
ncbi:MAG: hypothetical protein CL862_00025 [Cyanobium sp. NAT70]|nr:hypothetical protein [Cyanobium sp. NAT70]